MKLISPLWAVLVPLIVAQDVVVKRQSSSTASSSVFSLPTPSATPTVNSSDHDLSQKFCRIWRHQSVYANGKIYVDGGNTYIPNGNYTFNTMPAGSTNYEQGMNDVLLVIDLSSNFTNQETSPYSVIDKGPTVPNALIEGALWYSAITRKIYQLGGWFSFNSVSDPGYIKDAQIPESSIWEFDIDEHTWAQSSFNLSNTGSKVNRPGAAANCDAPTLNQSFIFEGYVQHRSDQDYINFTTISEFQFLEGMLSLDTNVQPPVLKNISVPSYMTPRMNGAMVHVPVGEKGVIVQIAGQTTMNPTPYGVGITNANAGNVNIDNSIVDLYDVETGYWFRQQTFGDIPTGRSDICTVLVKPDDGSSYNIFMIAGVQTYNSVIAYEDMYVLTLPTFQWVKVHTRPGGIYGHTCHAVGENLVVVGGMQTTDSGGNVNNCSAHMPAEIFSLVEMQYTGVFDAEGAKRVAPVPADVISLIGGTSSGGAVEKIPQFWSDNYLYYVFNPSLNRPAFTPNYTLATATSNSSSTATPSPPPSPKHHSNIGPIIGGAVGGVVVLAILATIIFICLKKRRASRNPPPSELVGELPSYQEAKDPHAVEVSSYQTPLQFTPYQPYPPQELQGEQGEERDEWRPLSVAPESPGSIPRRPVGATSPGLASSPRFSEVSAASGGSAGTPATAEGRLSRQSEVSN